MLPTNVSPLVPNCRQMLRQFGTNGETFVGSIDDNVTTTFTDSTP